MFSHGVCQGRHKGLGLGHFFKYPKTTPGTGLRLIWYNDVMSVLDENIGACLQGLEDRGALRSLIAISPEWENSLVRNGRRLINFSSNDYLGLSSHPLLIERAVEWIREWGAGAGASRLVTGTMDIHVRVEEKLARWKKTEAALIFNSGYQANSSVLSALLDRDLLGTRPLVFTDRLIHASLHHGCKSAGVRQIRFRHNDLGHLERLLEKHQEEKAARFIITESVFSMDGDRVDIVGLVSLAQRFGAFLYLDEAHATGVLGPHGVGLSGDVDGGIDLIMGTFSKAMGSFGAYIACSAKIRDYLVNRCHGFIYSTALPPPVLGAMDAALDLVPSMDDERTRLHDNADRLRAALKEAGIDYANSSTQIVPAVIGDAAAAIEASRRLEDSGILGIAIRPPTVPVGASRIRFAVTAGHTDNDIDLLVGQLAGLAG